MTIVIFAIIVIFQNVEEEAVKYFFSDLLYNENICIGEYECSSNGISSHIGKGMVKSRFPSYCINGFLFDKRICSDFEINSYTRPPFDPYSEESEVKRLWRDYERKKNFSIEESVKNNYEIKHCSFNEFRNKKENDFLFLKIHKSIGNRKMNIVQLDLVDKNERIYISLFILLQKKSGTIDWYTY